MCTERLSPARKNVKHPFTSVTSPANSRVPRLFPRFVSSTLPWDPRVSFRIQGYTVTAVETVERKVPFSLSRESLIQCLRAPRLKGARFPLFSSLFFSAISSCSPRPLSSLPDSNRVPEQEYKLWIIRWRLFFKLSLSLSVARRNQLRRVHATPRLVSRDSSRVSPRLDYSSVEGENDSFVLTKL